MTASQQSPVLEQQFETSAVVRRSAAAISCEVSDEAIILHLNSGVYFGLDPVGARIWALVERPRSIGEICRQLSEEYDVDAATCEASVSAFIRGLREKDLVSVGKD